jgi:hypothetical protein
MRPFMSNLPTKPLSERRIAGPKRAPLLRSQIRWHRPDSGGPAGAFFAAPATTLAGGAENESSESVTPLGEKAHLARQRR